AVQDDGRYGRALQRADPDILLGHRPRLVVGWSKAPEHDEVPGRVLLPRPAHLVQQIAEAGGARHAAREVGRQHPGRPGVEVHLVPEAQGVAWDALVPGLAGDDALVGLEREPAGELPA